MLCVMAHAQTNMSSSIFDAITADRGAIVAGVIYDLDAQKTVAAKNEFTRITPASLSKIYTSASAMDQLGPEYRFQTHLLVNGPVENGILLGDLIIKGGGDPTLGSRFFSGMQSDSVFLQLFQAIHKAGIQQINGSILADTDFFEQPLYPSLRLWEDMGNYYGSAPRSLSYKDNSFELVLKSPPQIGQVCEVVSIHPSCELDFVCRVKSAVSLRDSAYIYGHPGMKKWYIEGSIPAGRPHFAVKGAMPYPERIFVKELGEFLSDKGINIKDQIILPARKLLPRREIGVIQSPCLSSIIKVVNKQSNNLYADHLFLAMAKIKGEANWANAHNVQQQFWNQQIGDHTIYLHDGSGLSSYNQCSVNDMIRVLCWINESVVQKPFYESLAVSGEDGTLKNMWVSAALKGRIVGKSGYMKGVLGYAGYIHTKSNKKVAFCIIANRFVDDVSQMRRHMEDLIETIVVEY
jgi:D-alanyl-D-alanine carboxypeptidase/D-alanyl-D-alanine-endopeptidase (penicillin-binding protein 4)